MNLNNTHNVAKLRHSIQQHNNLHQSAKILQTIFNFSPFPTKTKFPWRNLTDEVNFICWSVLHLYILTIPITCEITSHPMTVMLREQGWFCIRFSRIETCMPTSFVRNCCRQLWFCDDGVFWMCYFLFKCSSWMLHNT